MVRTGRDTTLPAQIRELHAARARLTDDRLQERAYFDGAGWRTDAVRNRAPEELDRKIGRLFGIFPHGGRFILFTQGG